MTNCPVIYVRCDWDDVVRKPKGSFWVSVGKRGDAGYIYGKIERSGSSSASVPNLVGTNGFSAEILANDLLKVEHKQSLCTTYFLAPTKIFTDIHKKAILCMDFTTIGLGVSYCEENGLIVWDFNKEELKAKLQGHIGDVNCCKFFPSEKVILSGGVDMRLKIWCAVTGRCPVSFSGHKRAVTDLAIVDVGRNVISVSKDGTAKLWDCGKASCLATLLNAPTEINCCALTAVPPSYPVGQREEPISDREIGTQNKVLLVGCEDGNIHCIAVYSRRKLFTIVHQVPVKSVAFAQKSHGEVKEISFVVGCQNGEVFVYDLINPSEPLIEIWDLNSSVYKILPFKSMGFFVSHAEGTVYFIENCSHEKVLTLTGPDCDPVYSMATDGRFLYTSCRDRTIRRYAVEKALNRIFEL